MRRKSWATLALLVAAVPALAACGDEGNDHESMTGTDTPSRGDSSAGDSTAEFNDADVEFATGMIPHHQQAVEMAALAETRAQSPEVKKLAADIKAAQDPEIQTMTGWLESWGEPVPGSEHGGHDMSESMPESMPGMMTADEMTELEGLSGAEFDQMFLTMMIEHHEGAVEMAQAEQTDGQFPDAIALAEEIETAQNKEIATMRDLLK
ncbi:hypothetical protein ASE01_20435 [Nocardioides sp. Root190]|nr:hypothetical protein ASE01_20435 [Nocardioides sp. Root190]